MRPGIYEPLSSAALPRPSPLPRPGVSITPNRYGPPSRSIGESPMRGSSGDVRSSYGALLRQQQQQQGPSAAGSLPHSSSLSGIDRLSAGFSKLQSPSAAAAGALTKNGVSVPYSLSAQR